VRLLPLCLWLSLKWRRDIPYCDVFSVDRPLNNDEKLGLLTAKWDNIHEHTLPICIIFDNTKNSLI